MLAYTRLDEIRRLHPLIHCVNNIVSANDCANLLLAVGASPMMAAAVEEMEEITAISSATVLNTGTPDRERYAACRICGETAGAMGQPVVLDPVGVGASSWRLREVTALLDSFTPAILRVNLGEAQALLGAAGEERGVDSLALSPREERLALARRLADERRTVVLLTGPEDIVTDGTSAFSVAGGSALMSSVTGTGCMLSALCGAFAAAEPDPLCAAALASAFWKFCAEEAERAAGGRGPGSFRAALMDAARRIRAKDLADRAAAARL